MKSFFMTLFTSKINLSGILVMLIGLQDFIGNWDFATMTLKSWITFAIGLLIVIFRTYFTNTANDTAGK